MQAQRTVVYQLINADGEKNIRLFDERLKMYQDRMTKSIERSLRLAASEEERRVAQTIAEQDRKFLDVMSARWRRWCARTRTREALKLFTGPARDIALSFSANIDKLVETN